MARYSALHEPDAERICHDYALTYRRLEHLPGGMANSSYLLICNEGRFILTVLDNHDHTSANRLAHVHAFLNTRGIPVPVALPNREGRLVTDHAGRAIIVKRFIDGTCHTVLPADLLEAAGQTLAHINTIRRVPTDLHLPVHGRRLPPDATQRIATFDDRPFTDWLTTTLAAVHTVAQRTDDLSLVHGDLFADNIVVTPTRRLVILDWETASLDDPLLDLGMAIVGLCRTHGRFHPDRARTLISGYTTIRPLTTDDIHHLADATTYTSTVIAYHRYLRHHITHPNPANHHLYQEIPRFVDDLRDQWPAFTSVGSAG